MKDCSRPSWTVDIREDEVYRSSYGGYRGPVERHSCPNEECEHGGSCLRTTVRVVCLSCHVAHVITGESGSIRSSTTETTGYGEAPRKVGGLFLWPGEPWPWFDSGPREWLVSRKKPQRLHEEDLTGSISEGRGPRGGRTYSAAALPSPTGPYGIGSRIRWERAQDGFTSITAAAKWIASQGRKNGASPDHEGGKA
ncbi:hypothetical protein BIV24_19280 [Streptomyces colonosanans]|uniref:Uncharacterized protein n=2 Tax=Streptomyces colonosanans TaxID=1428652 RepID=A0A1S2P9W5_9ACTN|nr:hypothetical protein BIV24_19280 [Streptomyces colonosanans]